MMTIWWTRIGDRHREISRLAELDAERRANVVAEGISSLRALEKEVRWAPFLAGHAQARVLRATMFFYLV